MLFPETPQAFVAAGLTVDHLIGPSRRVGQILRSKAQRLKPDRQARAKLLIFGPPGTAKSTVALLTGRALVDDPTSIDFTPGREVTIDLVRHWNTRLSGNLFSAWTVKWIDELDLVTAPAQDMLLAYLDNLPPQYAFIGTSNLRLDLLQERFQSRLQQFQVDAPSTADIAAHLQTYGIAAYTAQMIAVGSAGNVRAALKDAETHLDVQAAA